MHNIRNIRKAVEYLLEELDPLPDREGLTETPQRMAKAFCEWTKGYTIDPKTLLKTFTDGAVSGQLVIVKDIPFYSMCEHHLAPFFGTATVAYIINEKMVGLSKINRLVDCFARRLQVQERMTQQIGETMQAELDPLGVAVILKARHMCMESRGVCQRGQETITTYFGGYLIEPSNREHIVQLVK